MNHESKQYDCIIDELASMYGKAYLITLDTFDIYQVFFENIIDLAFLRNIFNMNLFHLTSEVETQELLINISEDQVIRFTNTNQKPFVRVGDSKQIGEIVKKYPQELFSYYASHKYKDPQPMLVRLTNRGRSVLFKNHSLLEDITSSNDLLQVIPEADFSLRQIYIVKK